MFHCIDAGTTNKARYRIVAKQVLHVSLHRYVLLYYFQLTRFCLLRSNVFNGFLFFLLIIYVKFHPLPPTSRKGVISQISWSFNYFSNERSFNSFKPRLRLNCCNIVRMFIFGFGSVTLLCLWYLNLSNPVPCFVCGT